MNSFHCMIPEGYRLTDVFASGFPLSAFRNLKPMSTDFGKRLKTARKHAGFTQVQLAQAVGLGQSTLAGLEKEGFGSSHVATIAAACSVSPIWLATGEGPMHTEAVEASIHSNTAPGPEIRGKVPLISWVRAGELCETHDNYHPGDAEHWMDCPVPHGPRTYCLEISGDSMDDGGADAYRDGEIIFVDPDASPDPGRDVVVRTPDNKTTFKRLKEDTEGRYLLGLNGKKIVRVPEDTVFCGVVIFSGRRR